MTKATFSDLKFKLGEDLIPAHRCVIVARSEVLRSMLSGKFVDAESNVIEIYEVELTIFIAILHFIYCMTAPLEGNMDLVGILAAANQYALPRLVARCELALSKYVEKETADRIAGSAVDLPDLLRIAHAHNAKQLVAWCLHFISTNYSVFEKKGDIQRMDEESASYVIDNRWPPVSYLRQMEEYGKKYLDGNAVEGASSMKVCSVM